MYSMHNQSSVSMLVETIWTRPTLDKMMTTMVPVFVLSGKSEDRGWFPILQDNISRGLSIVITVDK